MNNLNTYIDHTVLKPTLLLSDVEACCKEAIEYQFVAVCVPPLFVKAAKAFLANTSIKVATVVGFPFGYSAIEAKLAEAVLAMVDGADELDVVANITAIKNNDWAYIANETNHIVPLVKSNGKTVKIIIESGVLTEQEIVKCCELYGIAEIDFLKTSTGYAAVGATVEAVKLMRKHLPTHIGIKASGGIKSSAFAQDLILAGASRLGCSSSIAIVKQQVGSGNY